MSKINVRSPYYITTGTVSNLTFCELAVFIYTGTQGQTSRPTTPTYLMASTPILNESLFEISELVKDYCNNTFNGSYSTEIHWVDYQITRYISGVKQNPETMVELKGFYGYGYFEDEVNPQNLKAILQSNDKIVKLDDQTAVIPVDTSLATRVTFQLNGQQVYSKAISTSTNSNAQIEYVTSGANGLESFEDRVLGESGIIEYSSCFEQFVDEFPIFDFDSVIVDHTTGSDRLEIQNVSECYYQPHKITFENKYGVLQDVWFFKRSNETLSVKAEQYKSNIIQGGSYSTSRHQQQILDKLGTEKLTLNTGYYPEDYNEVFKEMQLSENCWVEIDNKTLPIIVKDSSFAYLTQRNDKLINYTIEIEFAYDTINNIR